MLEQARRIGRGAVCLTNRLRIAAAPASDLAADGRRARGTEGLPQHRGVGTDKSVPLQQTTGECASGTAGPETISHGAASGVAAAE